MEGMRAEGVFSNPNGDRDEATWSSGIAIVTAKCCNSLCIISPLLYLIVFMLNKDYTYIILSNYNQSMY